MADAHPIASLRVLDCGRAEQHAEHRYGSRLPQLWWIFFGRRWVPLPLQCFLIEHRDRVVGRDELFDELWKGKVVSDSALSQAIKSALVIRGLRDPSADSDHSTEAL